MAATCAIILTSGIGVVAASPSLQQTLNQLSQEFLVLLSPVEGTSTSEGIRMEVLAAMRDNDVLMVYLTLQDIQNKIGWMDNWNWWIFQQRAKKMAISNVYSLMGRFCGTILLAKRQPCGW